MKTYKITIYFYDKKTKEIKKSVGHLFYQFTDAELFEKELTRLVKQSELKAQIKNQSIAYTVESWK